LRHATAAILRTACLSKRMKLNMSSMFFVTEFGCYIILLAV
jgi:hypothetical protein